MQTLTAPGALATKRRHDEAELLLELRLTGLTLRLSDHYIPAAPGPDITEVFQLVRNSSFDSDVGDWVDASTGALPPVWASDGEGGGYMAYSTPAAGGLLSARRLLLDVAVGEVVTIRHDVGPITGAGVGFRVRIGSTAGGNEYVSRSPSPGHFVDVVTCTSTILSLQFGLQSSGISVGTGRLDNVTAEVTRKRGTTTVLEALPLVASWGTLTEAMNILDAGGSPATAEVGFLNTKPIAGHGRLSDLIKTSGNATGYEFAFAEVVILRRDPGGAGLETVLGVFYLEEPTEIGDRILRLRMTDETLVLDQRKAGATLITPETFPDVDSSYDGKFVPVPIGLTAGLTTIPLKGGRASTLVGDIDDTTTTITVKEPSLYLAGASVMIDTEFVTLGSLTAGGAFVGCVRGASGTDANPHTDGVGVLPIRPEYLFTIGECTPDFPISAITNVKVNGTVARTSPTVERAANILDDGTERRYGVIRFTPVNAVAFHQFGTGQIPITIGVTTILALTDPQTSVSATKIIPTTFEGGVPTTRTLTYSVGSSGGSPTWHIDRKLGAGPWVEIATGGGTGQAATQDSRVYDSMADEQIRFRITSGSGYSQTCTITNYQVATGTHADGTGSTAAAVIGKVTCDVVGIVDAAPAIITPSPGSLLENPVDVVRYVLTQRYGAQRPLGPSWAITRARLAGHTWSFPFGQQDAVPFDEFRQMVERQSRCRLFLDGDRWEFVYQEDHNVPAVVLDYASDIWVESVSVARTERMRLFNSVIAKSQYDWVEETYRRTKRYEPSGLKLRDRIEQELTLPWVQSAETADMLAAYWLALWSRQRWTVTLVAYQNVLALMKADTFSLVNHPVLAAHGGAGLVFRITGKDYRLSDEHSGRIALTAIEVPS